jgi:hypothetical protein
LTFQQRKTLEEACTKGRRVSEKAVRAALTPLAVTAERPPARLGEDDRLLRRGLRAKARQLGDKGDNLDLLIAECAYEQWHRLLFARFLAESNLLIHPDYGAPVTLDDCEELAESVGEPDGWSVAARFAAEILPGIFRLTDPCVRLRLAPEGRLALEGILADLPAELFGCDDALGWVYQFWQKEKKDEVNTSERKIGGSDLGPVTQLFTENYMVRFLLQNSLGAWWAARYPNSQLIKGFEYLLSDDVGTTAAGAFDGWPDEVRDVTVMDPCCGSGHFLVEAFSMLWQMRSEAEGLEPSEAQDLVLRENLFGLELDPRCVQIAMFALAQAAWKERGGWRQLPVPNIACSGVPVHTSVEEWKSLGAGEPAIENALVRLHILFRNADTLGSLIDPRRVSEASDPTGLQTSTDDVDWVMVAPLLARLGEREAADPAASVWGTEAAALGTVASMLSSRYTLVSTNVPYLGRTGQGAVLREHLTRYFADSAEDLATAFTMRLLGLTAPGGTVAEVLPESSLFLGSLERFRRDLLSRASLGMLALLGPGAFAGIGGEVVRVGLLVGHQRAPSPDHRLHMLDVGAASLDRKPGALREARTLESVQQGALLKDRLARIMPGLNPDAELLSKWATSNEGMSTGDGARYQRNFWELGSVGTEWILFQRAPDETKLYGGLDTVVLWEGGRGRLSSDPGARVQGMQVWDSPGVLIERMSSLRASLYMGGAFQKSTVVVRPRDPSLVPAIWEYCRSGEHKKAVLAFERRIGIATSAIVDVPFDDERWREVARAAGATPEPRSDDPTQWLFEGHPQQSNGPLQVAVARLLGYRWPKAPSSDVLSSLADADGIVCLPSVAGEPPAADRLQHLLAAAFGQSWSPAKLGELLEESGSKRKNLGDWLRDDFFKQHCALFGHRPFVWHIWDGKPDGFAALVNYHRLDHATLEKLTYTYLGNWIERQRAEVRDERAGAEARLAAASKLRTSLELILEGEPPHDIYVRWKSQAEQPLGWDPDPNDGVRVNVRPFVEAGVLRSSFNIHWRKDRGTNPDGSERLNDLRLTNAEKRAARGSST